MVAPLVYGAAVCLGGMLSPHYSPMSQAVSDLIATGAPNKALLDILFALYNVLSLCFASALYYQVHTTTLSVPKRVGEIGAGVLFAQGIFGLVTLCFPEPASGMSAAMTHTGKMHIVFAGLSSLTTMLSILLMGFWFNKSQHLRRYAVYSFFSVAIIFLTGGFAAISVATQSPFAGVVERITIGGFMQWLFVIALAMVSNGFSQSIHKH
jgi:hypothetical protein